MIYKYKREVVAIANFAAKNFEIILLSVEKNFF